MIRYDDRIMLRMADMTSTLVCFALPVASVAVLSYIHDAAERVVFIAITTMVFTLLFGVLTNARRVEILAATAA